MINLEQVLAAELRRHRFLPGKYPDPDYCSCGARFGLYTKGEARGQWDWHVARELVIKLSVVQTAPQQQGVGQAKN
jgi:hypothetical protein